ncbi:MAG: polyprenyl synthetase family protein [Firmicutes bacterium]|nr:polyprenyl synthetase family protein [Bacillota bacterium]MBQ5415264.1 polyprenyl synthetase family protein [Bacillota bacterium]
MIPSSGKDAYKRYKDLVDEHILDFIPEIDQRSKDLYSAMKYALLTGGKRIRPCLVMASCDMFNTPMHFVIPYACAAEYIHTYSLVHDDLPCMDDDDLRRGKPTVHKEFGEDIAVLAGDGLLSAAFETMNKDMLMYLDDPELLKRKVKAAFSLSKGCGCRGMVAGQIADIQAEGTNCSTDLITYINYNKTAALIRACVMAGGFLGGMPRETFEDLSRYGENIGMAFQLADDLEDARSGQDEGRATYINEFGIEQSRERALEHIDIAKKAVEKYYDHAEIYMYLAEYLEEKLNV